VYWSDGVLEFSPNSTEKFILHLCSVTFVLFCTACVLKFHLDDCQQLGCGASATLCNFETDY
jgi:hypothetical protein